jgi:hypothetical protein
VKKLRSIQLISVFDLKRAVMILGLKKYNNVSSLILDVSEEQENLLKQYNIEFIDSNDPANYCF